jgi:uncharacterized membrane protein HdeD (DUF308 family)
VTALAVGTWWSLALRGAAGVVFGLLTLIWPGLTLFAFVILFGGYALFDGLAAIASVLFGETTGRDRRRGLLLHGLLGTVIGAITLAWPDLGALSLLYLVAAWAVAAGGLTLAAAVRLRRQIGRNDWALAGVGGLLVLLAVILVVRPGTGALALTWAIGGCALAIGVLLLVMAWRTRSLGTGTRPSRVVAA